MLLTERQPFWHHPRVSEARCVPQLFTPAVVALAGAAAHRRSAVLRPSAAVLPMAVGARWRVAESRCAPGCLSSRCKNPFCHCRHAKCENDWSPPMGILAALGPTHWETDAAFFANFGRGRSLMPYRAGRLWDLWARPALTVWLVSISSGVRLVVEVGLGTLFRQRDCGTPVVLPPASHITSAPGRPRCHISERQSAPHPLSCEPVRDGARSRGCFGFSRASHCDGKHSNS